MQVKTFYPMILTTDLDAAMKNLATFGFSEAHNRDGATDVRYDLHVLKNEQGHRVDVLASKIISRDFVGIRINVADYETAVAELKAQGYRAMRTDGVESAVARAVMLASPQGIPCLVIEHKQ